MTLHVQVVTPEKVILDIEAQEVIVPTVTGELAILPQHVPLFTQLAPGELTIKVNDRTEHLVVVGGFLEVTRKTVTILADYAINAKDINEQKAQEAKERAEKALQEKTDSVNQAEAEAEFMRAIIELRVASKIKRVA